MVDLDYDKDADVFYITFGEPKEAVCEEISDGVLLRRHESGKIVGITIIGYKSIVDDSRPRAQQLSEKIRRMK
jgi:uncharacterized protein YuzE